VNFAQIRLFLSGTNLSGYAEHFSKMDPANPSLERSIKPVQHPVRGQNARELMKRCFAQNY